MLLLVCNQNIRFVFCDFRRRRKWQKTKPGLASAKTSPLRQLGKRYANMGAEGQVGKRYANMGVEDHVGECKKYIMDA